MENSYCYICKTTKNMDKNKYIFTCHHSLCINCLYYLIFENHIKEINIEKIIVNCNCKEGFLDVTLDNLYELFNLKYNLNDSDKERENCSIHLNDEKNLFCKSCNIYVCEKCSKSHSGHLIIKVDEYAKYIKKFLSGIPLTNHSLKDFIDKFDLSLKNLYNDVENLINKTIKIINETIDSLTYLKIQYIEHIKQKYTQSIKLFKIIKMFFSDFYCEFTARETITDIFKLKHLRDIKYEFLSFQTQINPEFLSILSSIKEKTQDLPDSINQILSYKLNYKEVSRGYVQVDKIYGHKKAIYTAIQLNDGRICTGSGDFSIRIWEEKNGSFENTITIKDSYGEVVTLFQNNEGKIFSSTKGNNTIRVYVQKFNKNNQEIYECESTLSDHSDIITWMIQLNDNRLVTSSRDKSIKVWEKLNESYVCKETLLEHEDAVYCVQDILNKRLASVSGDTTIRIWREKNNKFNCTHIINGHEQKVRSIALMKDGRLVSTGDDCTIKIWREEGEKFKCVISTIAHRHLINSVIVLKDGRIVTASADKTVRVWKDGNRRLIKSEVLRMHKKIVMGVIELKDKRLISYDADSIGLVWKNGYMFD